MTVAAVSMMRDEADIVEPVIRHMATQVDFMLVADNRSCDGTREILASLAECLPLTVIEECQPGYYQGSTLTALSGRAAAMGAKWVVPFDADEVHFSPHGRIADVLAGLPRDVCIAAVPSYNYVATADDPDEPDPIVRIRWREPRPFVLSKVACRALPGLRIDQGSHSAAYGEGEVEAFGEVLAIRHFPYRSPQQFVRKVENGAAAYAATAFTGGIGVHWRRYGEVLKRDGPAALERIFYEHYYREDPRVATVVDGKTKPPLVFDPVPKPS